MIQSLAILLVVSVLLLALIQTILVINYQWFMRDSVDHDVEGEDFDFPKASVILCLRGYEPGIADCIAELVGQNYPNFELHIAFDSESDPAHRQVVEFFENHKSKAHIHTFKPQESCSYKCSAIIHVVSQLDESVEFVAFCDGDAIVDEMWLKDLVLPMLSDTNIGATTGNRWFSPVKSSLGSQVRKNWNAAAVVQMQAYDIAWGGSMAIRRSVIDQCSLTDRWSKSFCEDTPLASALKKERLKTHRIANLIIENNETTNLRECFAWIARQLLTVRLHHPGWPLVMLHGLITGVATIIAPTASVLLFISGAIVAGRSVLLAWLVYQIVNAVLLTLIGIENRKAMTQRNASKDHRAIEQPSGMTVFGAGILVQLLHPVAVIKTVFTQTVQWRGIAYRVSGRHIRVRN